MNKSHYFEELSSAYSAEIDDLTSDFEGKTVLSARLKEKRGEIDFLLQMIDSAPEMVAPIFYGAFSFVQPAVMIHAVQAEPDDGDFPEWDAVSASIRLTDWAQLMAEQILNEPGGDRFMVSAAGVEFLRLRELATPAAAAAPAESGDKDKDGDDDGEDQDLAEAGAEWMSQQGFDAQTS
jgi:hypothetical protein